MVAFTFILSNSIISRLAVAGVRGNGLPVLLFLRMLLRSQEALLE